MQEYLLAIVLAVAWLVAEVRLVLLQPAGGGAAPAFSGGCDSMGP